MDGFVASKLDEFEQGKISRRRLIETLTLAATTAYAATPAQAQAPKLKMAALNHVSYTCPNFKQAGEWYAKVFNLDTTYVRDTELALTYGKMGEQPLGVTAKDVPIPFLLFRTRSGGNPRYAGRPSAEAVIDHVAYTVADFNRDRVKAELTAMGLKNVRDGGPRSVHVDDPFGYDVQITGLESHALSEG